MASIVDRMKKRLSSLFSLAGSEQEPVRRPMAEWVSDACLVMDMEKYLARLAPGSILPPSIRRPSDEAGAQIPVQEMSLAAVRRYIPDFPDMKTLDADELAVRVVREDLLFFGERGAALNMQFYPASGKNDLGCTGTFSLGLESLRRGKIVALRGSVYGAGENAKVLFYPGKHAEVALLDVLKDMSGVLDVPQKQGQAPAQACSAPLAFTM